MSTCFAREGVDLNEIIEVGPVAAEFPREKLFTIANKLIIDRTSKSSAASFVAGIPGGLAMAATIPADVLQFFGMSLRMAQELSYLYGAPDLWQDGVVDNEQVSSQLIMYCGVMFGVAGAVSGIRLLSSQIAKQTLKKLPQKALTKTLWYPMVKQVGKAIGVKVTKSTVAKGVSKAVPIIGGVVSAGLNFASMMPMGKRLLTTLDKANFDYTEAEAEADYEIIAEFAENDGTAEQSESINVDERSKPDSKIKGIKEIGADVSEFFGKLKKNSTDSNQKVNATDDDIFTKIEKLSKLKDIGAITQEEYDAKKAELLSMI